MPKAGNKTKAQLISELEELRLQNATLQAAQADFIKSEDQTRRLQEMAVRNRVVEVLLTVPDDRAYREILQVLLDATGSMHGVFGYIDDDGALVVPYHAIDTEDRSQNACKINRFSKDAWGDTAGSRAIVEKRTVCSNEPSGDVPEPYFPLRRQISVPVLHQGTVLGLIQVANKEKDYDERDIAFVESIAAAIAPGLDLRRQRERRESSRLHADQIHREADQKLKMLLRKSAEEQARNTKDLQDEIAARMCAEDRNHRQRSLLEAMGKMLVEAPVCVDERAIACSYLAVAQRLTGSKFGYFGQINHSGRLDVIALNHPDWDTCKTPELDASLRIADVEIGGIWANVLRDGKPLRSKGLISSSESAGLPKGHPPLTSFLAVPLRQSAEILGIIALANKPSGYDDTDQEMVEALSKVAVAALMHKRTQVALHEAQRELLRQENLVVLAQLTGGVDHKPPNRVGRVNTFFQSCLNRYERIASFVPLRVRRSLNHSAGPTHDRGVGVTFGPFRKVLIASPRPIFQEAVKCALGSQAETTMVVTADIAEDGLTIAEDTRPDVVVVDLSSAGMSGLRAMAILREQLPDARLVAVSPVNSKSMKIAARECGADKLILGDTQGKSFGRDLRSAILSP